MSKCCCKRVTDGLDNANQAATPVAAVEGCRECSRNASHAATQLTCPCQGAAVEDVPGGPCVGKAPDAKPTLATRCCCCCCCCCCSAHACGSACEVPWPCCCALGAAVTPPGCLQSRPWACRSGWACSPHPCGSRPGGPCRWVSFSHDLLCLPSSCSGPVATRPPCWWQPFWHAATLVFHGGGCRVPPCGMAPSPPPGAAALQSSLPTPPPCAGTCPACPVPALWPPAAGAAAADKRLRCSKGTSSRAAPGPLSTPFHA